MMSLEALDVSRIGMSVASRLSPRPDGHVILVTSARPGEGKSFISRLLAKDLSKTLAADLVLADASELPELPEMPDLTARMEPEPPKTGLSKLIADGKLPQVEPSADDSPRLFYLSGGNQLKANLFNFSGVSRAFGILRARFKVTLVDAPILTECGALLMNADAVLLVVDSRRTAPSEIQRAMSVAQLDPRRITGVLLNHTSAVEAA